MPLLRSNKMMANMPAALCCCDGCTGGCFVACAVHVHNLHMVPSAHLSHFNHDCFVGPPACCALKLPWYWPMHGCSCRPGTPIGTGFLCGGSGRDPKNDIHGQAMPRSIYQQLACGLSGCLACTRLAVLPAALMGAHFCGILRAQLFSCRSDSWEVEQT